MSCMDMEVVEAYFAVELLCKTCTYMQVQYNLYKIPFSFGNKTPGEGRY